MIKIYGSTYYMTCGEACYIACNDGGLKHVCFGKRIEPEDDAALLGGAVSAFNEVEDEDIKVYRADKRIAPSFAVRGAEIEDKRGISVLPTLRGEETLKVSAVDEKNGLELTLYYTPYIRGGVARRAELKNVSDKPIKIKRLMSGGAATGDGEVVKLFGGLTAVKTHAGVYGIFTLHAGTVETVVANGRISSGAKLDITLGAGETFYTPEALIVYSDNGVGGVVRAYHDIIREFGVPRARLEKRRAIVVYCPTDGGADTAEKRVKAAAATGADTVAVDAACGKAKALKYAEKVKAYGMRIGLSAEFSKIGALAELVEACGAEYVELDCDGLESYEHAAAAYAQYVELKNKYSNIEIDFGHKKVDGSAEQRLKSVAHSPVPLCAVRNVVDEGLPLKTAFDVASFGALGYRLDPSMLNEGAIRAIRAQILSYQDDATTVNLGDVYDIGGGIMAVGKDKSKAFAATAGAARFNGLDVHNLYHVRELGKTLSGAALGFYGVKENDGGTVTYHIRQVADYE